MILFITKIVLLTFKQFKMTKSASTLFIALIFIACNPKVESPSQSIKGLPLQGTWKLLTGTLIEKGDTTVTDYTSKVSFIKIINGSHFAFLQHDLNKGADSSAVFSAGGGSYTLNGNNYTESLEYCNARNWEGNDFSFTITIAGDTLVQQGIEKIEKEGIERINIEKYIRVK